MKVVPGGDFILDAPQHVPAVWGDHNDVLWASGEPLVVCGTPGVGKSTLIQQVIKARMGGPWADLSVLGYSVTPDSDRRVLYIAGDRPAQIARSMRRMVSAEEREYLNDRLVVVRGALDFSIVDEPHRLQQLAALEGAGTVVIDSLKDVASPLSEDRVGSGVKAALTMLTEEGIEVCALHHQRKSQTENKKPTKLDDVYGSAWITAGAGSVVLLHGQAGEPLVELLHLKQPADEVGPLKVLHDHEAGRSDVVDTLDAYDLLKREGTLTAKEAAKMLFGTDGRGDVEKARRRLNGLVSRGVASEVPGEGEKAPSRWVWSGERVIAVIGDRDSSTPDHDASRLPMNTDHGAITGHHDATENAPTPLKGGGRDERDPRCAVWDEAA